MNPLNWLLRPFGWLAAIAAAAAGIFFAAKRKGHIEATTEVMEDLTRADRAEADQMRQRYEDVRRERDAPRPERVFPSGPAADNRGYRD